MKWKTYQSTLALVLGFMLVSVYSIGQIVAGNDIASNYTTVTWVNGSNEGTGFGPWQLWSDGGNSGFYIGSSTSDGHADINTSTNSFGMYGHTGEYANAQRAITAWANESTFSLQMAVQWRNGAMGLSLFNQDGFAPENEIWNFNVSDAGYGTTSWDYYSDMRLTFSINQDGDNLAITVTGESPGGAWTDTWSTTVSTETLGGFKIYKGNGVADGQNNLFFNNLNLTRSPINATIDPTEITFYENWDNTDPQLTISWNDATSVTGMSIYLADGGAWFPLPEAMWAVTNDNGTTATLNIYYDELPNKFNSSKDDEFLYDSYQLRVEFDQGEPALLQLDAMVKTFLVELQVTDEFGDPIPAAEVFLGSDWNSGNQGTVVDNTNNPIFEVTARGDYMYHVSCPSYANVQGFITNIEEDLSIPIVMDPVWQVTYEVIGENGWLNAYINEQEYFGSGQTIVQGTDIHFEASPNWDYTVKEWRVNGVVVEGNTSNQYTYSNLQSDIAVTVEFKDYIWPELIPEYQVFGLDEADDVNFTISWGSETEVAKIFHFYFDEFDEYQEILLTEGTDYDVTGDVLTIYANFIVSLSPEAHSDLDFNIEFGSGKVKWFGIVILQTTSAQINPTELTYDLTNPDDVMTTIVWGPFAQAVESISTITKYDLVDGTDYHINGAWLFLHNSYLTQNLTAAENELNLNVLFDNGNEVLLTVTAIESGIANATINPTSVTYLENELPEYVDITITWNDATAVTSMHVLVSGEWGSEEMDWPFYVVTDNGDGTANLRINFEEPKINLLNTKEQEFTYVTVTINFDVGAPALFLMTQINEYYEVIVTIDPIYSGWVSGNWDYYLGETVELEAYPQMDYVFLGWKDAETGNIVSYSNPYSFVMPSNNVELIAQFILIQNFPVTFSVIGENGSLTCTFDGTPITSGDEIASASELVFTATPEANYRVMEWKLNGVLVEGNTSNSFVIEALETAAIVTVEFELIPPMYTVTFTVTEGTNPIEGATVSFDGADYTTNASGIAAIADVEAGTYNYTVSMTGYTDATGTVTVTDANVNVDLVLPPNSVEQSSISSIRAYPNPFDNHITITNAEMVKRVVITNLIGQQVMSINLNGETTVTTNNLASGIYLITFEGFNGQRAIRKMIKK
ncbi:MAG: X2-like carbohydrate binding domain-containing protein [Bacteroidales bacterium]|nr:X2-like carbohydrate binding domain-containing protein [Bacteroidales bacterium]